MVEMLVECDYAAKKQDELTVKKGDVIRDVIKKSPGWYEGFLNDRRGLFPDHCVGKDAAVILRAQREGGRRCRVVFSYLQDHEDELNLKVGEVIDVLGEEEEGWWRGLLNGREGVFPSNFVQEIALIGKAKKPAGSREDLNSLVEPAEPRTPSLPPKPVKTICEVKYAYQAQNEDELSLKDGDQITLISKDGVDPGWWKGELNGRVGVFPDNFVVVLPSFDDVTLRVKPPSQQQQTADAAKPASQRSSASDGGPAKNPPVPAKKPAVPIKKSPSSGGGGGSIFQGLRKKLEGIDRKDAVDGGMASKNKYEVVKGKRREDENQNAFDQVERNSLLKDVRAGRARPPVRRPPTNANKEETADVFDSSSESDTGNARQETQEAVEIKPQVREWEKHKAPWLEEMKMNQAKRSSTSPGPENKRTPCLELEDIKSLPEKEGPIDMSRSMPALSSKRLKSPLESENVTAKPTKPILKPPAMANNESHLNLYSNVNSFNSNIPAINNLNLNINDHHHIDKKSESKSPEPPNNIPLNNTSETITYKQYIDLIHRVEVLERLVEKQGLIIAQQNHIHQTAIDELRLKLVAEIDKRLVLENEFEKVAHCMNL